MHKRPFLSLDLFAEPLRGVLGAKADACLRSA